MAKKKEKKNLFTSLKTYLQDVKKEAGKVMWTSKKNLIKYSVATLAFILFICLFFVASDVIIALISNLKELMN